MFDESLSASRAAIVSAAALALLAGTVSTAVADDSESHQIASGLVPEMSEELIELALDSGVVRADARNANGLGVQSVYEETVHVPNAWSVRLVFNQAVLAGRVGSGDESFIVITSELDGAVQVLDAETIKQWQHTSAYFNGDTVKVEVFATPGTGDNRLRIAGVRSTSIDRVGRSICGSVDDRVLSNDLRQGRVWPIGCTAWMIENQPNCMLTAGHCGPSTSQVIEFNVPLSTSGGTPQHPSPDDQYPVDPASIQTNSGGSGPGDDWAYFGVFDNSNTGLSPLAAQSGGTYFLAASAPPVSGQSIRITGYGSTSSPVSPTFYLAQKTHVGPYALQSGNLIRYSTDTTGGNSGSPVYDESTGLAIGIHTHAGCSSTGGSNQGTAIHHPALQNALANPQGICASFLSIGFDGGLPESVSPDGGDTIQAEVSSAGATLEPGTVMLHVDTGSGFVAYPMTQVLGDIYEGTFPPAPCGETIAYYVSAEDTDANVYTAPGGGAGAPNLVLVTDTLGLLASMDFESAPGWTVADHASLITGTWELGVPGNWGRGDPATDYDGSGSCYVTHNANNVDVDGGPTTLTSEVFDLSGSFNPLITYARWFTNDDNDADNMTIEFSGNGGASWTTVEVVSNTPGWVEVQHQISDYVPLTSQFQVRFSVTDNPNNSVTEGAIDALSITDPQCDPSCLADIDGDGDADADDIAAFVDLFVGAGLADIDNDGDEDADDIAAFVSAFVAGC